MFIKMWNILTWFLILNIFYFAQSSSSDNKTVVQKDSSKLELTKTKHASNETIIVDKILPSVVVKLNNTLNKTAPAAGNSTSVKANPDLNVDNTPNHILNHGKIDHPGALLRGFYVFLGLSVIVLGYFLIRAFRLRPGAPQSTTVRKYGVVGRRSDMEMLPLPLAEEEDDDTLFDVGNQLQR